MKNQNKNYINMNAEWYKARINDSKENIEILSSGTNERRDTRFSVHQQLGIKSGSKVLDIGCGYADFYTFLNQNDINVEYHGVDIVEEFIDKCNENFSTGTFEFRNFLEDKFEENSFDYVVCSQVLNLNFNNVDNETLAQDFLREMYSISKKGVSCDFITDYVDFKEDYLFYYSPERMFSNAKKITKRVNLIHDYPLYEFCLYLFPDFSGWAK